jgi:hypothetical protein
MAEMKKIALSVLLKLSRFPSKRIVKAAVLDAFQLLSNTTRFLARNALMKRHLQ